MTVSSIAIHEAGHAVIARVLGMHCEHVTIVPDRDSAGHAIANVNMTTDKWLDAGIWRSEETVVRAYVLQLMAGAAANIEFGQSTKGDGDDQRKINHALDSIYYGVSDEQFKRMHDRLRRIAARLVRRHRDRIALVARALSRRKTLSASEVDALIAPVRVRALVSNNDTRLAG